MNNSDVEVKLTECDDEMIAIDHIIQERGASSNIVPYLTKYAAIKTCGAIEQAYKTIIADKCTTTNNQNANNFIDNMIRNSSDNPRLDKIHKMLKKFNETWNTNFKHKINSLADVDRVKQNLDSLVTVRNSFAHGKTSTASFNNVKEYYTDSKKIIECLDEVIF